MAAKSSSASSLSWLWVIETLGSFDQVDTFLLIDLIKRTPDISDDLGKNAREMVSLRCLESLFGKSTNDVPSALDSKIGFDPSERCEDVLQRILQEISASNLRMAGPEMLKWDVHPFITHKRACLPKCALQQLKDTILEGSHPFAASLKERSGLAFTNQCDVGIPVDDGDPNAVASRLDGNSTNGQIGAEKGNLISRTPENEKGLLQEDSPTRNLVSSKRDRSDSATENLAGQFHENQISMNNGCDLHLNAKKLKQDASCTIQSVGQNSVPLHGNELLEDSSGRIVQHTGREGCDLRKESHAGCLEESRFSEDDRDEYVALKRLGQSSDVDDDEGQYNIPQIPYNNNKMPQNTSGDGPHQNVSVDEAKGDSEHCAEPRTSNGATADENQQKISVNETKDNSEHSFQLKTSSGAPPDGSHLKNFTDETKDDLEHHYEPEMLSDSDGYHDEDIDITMKKHNFLSSQCTFSYDSLQTADWTELNLCMKCNKDGRLLVCSASGCPLVVHESCLGSSASFDDSGNFYCPFCAYSRAILKYLEVKKKASLARKNLAAFIGLGFEHKQKKLSKRLRREEQNQLQDGDVDENPQNRGIEDNRQAEPSAPYGNDNLPCGEEEAAVIGKRGDEKMVQEHQSLRGLEGQQNQVEADRKRDGDDSSSRDTEIVLGVQRHAEVGIQQEVLQQPVTDPPEDPSCAVNIDSEGTSEEENDKSIASNYSIRFRRRERHYTYPAIPQLRRKKVPWTAVEEEILKEGVRRFSSVDDRSIPWKKILEFGGTMFQKGRTTIDLKDKWRNICKGSPKSK